MANHNSFVHYELFDALGATRKQGITGENSLTIDVSDLPSGSYYFRASTPNGIPMTKQLVIMR
jgi:hypothetical protein